MGRRFASWGASLPSQNRVYLLLAKRFCETPLLADATVILGGACTYTRIKSGVYDFRSVVIVWALLDDQDREVRVRFRKTASNHTAGETTCCNHMSVNDSSSDAECIAAPPAMITSTSCNSSGSLLYRPMTACFWTVCCKWYEIWNIGFNAKRKWIRSL